MNNKLSAKINSLPQKPGVYLFRDKAGRLLYVGKAIKIKNRVRSHFSKNSDIYKGDLIKKIANIDFVIAANEKEALILENELIKKYLPKYNIQWRDDKSYFWVDFTRDEWPRLKIVHKANLSSEAQGPFTNGTELKQTLRALRKAFPFRTCKNAYNKPCLQWHLNLCPAHNNRLPLIAYRRSLDSLRQFLRLYANQQIRIEAYDISNIQGTNAVGSMVVFKGAKPDKSQYRKFKIKTVRGANDIAMLKEVLRRRFAHAEWPLPNIMLIDGGRAQLNAAIAIARSQLPKTAIVALAKQDEEIYTIYSSKALRLIALPISLQLAFQAVRNEAHRFAISYYRHLHGKSFKRRNTTKKARN
ncbi:MAG TPA: GIY-YIG nuclease family protein [Candidatus Portnoybacteria bacterium]|nr:GIY-YIG nuclease family protein [Candidatus Portnoybacteria bacterium]